MTFFEIIKTVRVTEKGTRQSDSYNQYTFVVDPRARKPQIKDAIEELFQVKVTAVRTMNVRGKLRAKRTNHPGSNSSWKKAIVTLKKGDKINLA